MTEIGEDNDPKYADRISTHADTHRQAWSRTLTDMKGLAADLEEDGWNAIAIAAGHTAPNPPDAGDTSRWGFVHVIPGNYADEFSEAFEAGEFPQYQVFQKDVDGRVFMVTQFLDPGTETAILIAGSYEMRHAPGLVKTAQREEEMYTHVQKLDKTVLGTFKHDEYERFFPEPEKYEAYVVEPNVGVSDEQSESENSS